MKNKLGVELEQVGEVRASCEPNKRRESAPPRIVVCPPGEKPPAEGSAPRAGSRLRALGRRVLRRADDDDASDGSSSGSDFGSSGGSEASSDASSGRPRNRSSISLRRVFQSLSITRSLSSSPQARPKKNPQPQRILRPPVVYTYVRGLSGLPTQRVPRARPSGLNR